MLPKFRETLWFKRGHYASSPEAVEDPAAQMPIEDRYDDDGSVNSDDSVAFSVRTGTTQHVPRAMVGDALADGPAFEARVLARQLKGGRAAVAMAMAVLVVVALAVAGVVIGVM